MLVVVTTLIVAACGGDDDPTATTAPRPTVAPTAVPTAAPTATTAPAEPTRGGTIRTRMLPFPSWDTYNVRGGFSFIFVASMVNGLIHLSVDDPGVIVPDLAESWNVSADGTVYTFNLKRGVQWQDGEAFNSEDAAYNLDAAWKPSSQLRSWNAQFMRRVTGISAPDEFTVQVTLEQPSASFLPGLATPHLLMYPEHIRDMDAWQANPVGTGPFKFNTFVVDIGLTVVRNDNYFKSDEAGRQLPFLDGVEFNIINDPTAAMAAFRAGRLDCGCSFDTDFMTPNRELLKRDFPDMQVVEFWSPGFLYFNQKGQFTDQRVRQAISIAIDRRLFAGTIQDGFMHFPGSPFYSPEVGGQWGLTAEEMQELPGWREDRAADEALMKQLLSEAGLDPSDVKVSLLGSQQFTADVTIIDTILQTLGIDSSFRVEPRGSLGEARREGRFDISYETPGPAFDDPLNFGSNRILEGGADNFGKWVNPEIERLFQEVDLELDPVKRLSLAKELQRAMIDWAVLVPMPYTGRSQGVRGYVKGWNHITPISVDVSGRLETVWIDQSLR